MWHNGWWGLEVRDGASDKLDFILSRIGAAPHFHTGEEQGKDYG
jgi:hypothetical protein